MQPANILIDIDVLINWLIKEVETKTHKEIWKAPFEIIRLVEEEKCKGSICLNSLLEIRFLMRRKKKAAEERIKEDIDKISSLFEVVIPDEICLIRANQLQTNHPLDPFDAIALATALSLKEITLISRDSQFLRIASQLIDATTPEEFLLKVK